MKSPFRAEQIGSLLRPDVLKQARAAYVQGHLPEVELRALEDQAILDALAHQRRAGIDVYTDGEMRRSSWLSDMAEAVAGFVTDRVDLEWHGPGGGKESSTAYAGGSKLRKIRQLTGQELPFLKKSAPGPFKITIPSPSNFMISSYKRGITDKCYSSRAEFLDDIVEILRDEINWVQSQGAAYIQFDAPYYSFYFDPHQRDRMKAEGRDPDDELERAIAADNAVFRDFPRESCILALHVCRGNSRSRWFTEGSYDSIAEKLFGSLNVDVFLLEYDSERAGNFAPLRLVPRDKSVVLGLITTKRPELESGEALQGRVDEAAQYIPLENLAISTQCGFASTAPGNLLSMDDQWRKLELVVQTARKIWG